jgi:hypothetical protein
MEATLDTSVGANLRIVVQDNGKGRWVLDEGGG